MRKTLLSLIGAALVIGYTVSTVSQPSLECERNIPANLQGYVEKKSTKEYPLLQEIGVDEIIRETPYIIRADFAYWLHKRGWPCTYIVDVGLPWLPIRKNITTRKDEPELYRRVGNVMKSLLKSLEIGEVYSRPQFADREFKDFPKKGEYKGFVRLSVP